MKGFVRTPRETVDAMVELLFRRRPPSPHSSVLDPGCGTGEFIDGVIRWCDARRIPLPRITGIECDASHLPTLQAKFARRRTVRVEHGDFLADGRTAYDYIIGNPPYVPITALSEIEKQRYRARYVTAHGRVDLYLLVEEIRLVREDTFGDLATYPTITVLRHASPATTRVVRRDGTTTTVTLPRSRESWLPAIEGAGSTHAAVTLGDLCLRLSCGVATGADGVFVRAANDLDPALRRFAYPTIAGRELTPMTTTLTPHFAMLIPYDADGGLLPLERLGALGRYLSRADVRRRLLARTCVRRKPWYAFHETPPLRDILRPKILCKDIGQTPRFWVDRRGEIVPRHSVYYIIPRDPAAIDAIAGYLRSPTAHEWLMRNCQRATKGFLRLQSRVLQRLPVPNDVAPAATGGRGVARADAGLLQSELPFEFRGRDAHTV
jgi:adenine-specific DNA-methyltransferase